MRPLKKGDIVVVMKPCKKGCILCPQVLGETALVTRENDGDVTLEFASVGPRPFFYEANLFNTGLSA